MGPTLPLSGTAALAATVIALGAAGCGGGGDSNGTPAGPTTAAQGNGRASTVDLKATDFEFTPSDPTVKAGQVTFDVTNDGQTLHNVEVEGPNGEAELSSDLSPGQSGVLTVDLSEPGEYEFYCPVGNHREEGMEGTITVR
jgi:uncharacterized cupredoxin-like copper-binding protein